MQINYIECDETKEINWIHVHKIHKNDNTKQQQKFAEKFVFRRQEEKKILRTFYTEINSIETCDSDSISTYNSIKFYDHQSWR